METKNRKLRRRRRIKLQNDFDIIIYTNVQLGPKAENVVRGGNGFILFLVVPIFTTTTTLYVYAAAMKNRMQARIRSS